MTAAEAYNLPIHLKRWWITRISNELNKKGPNGESSSRALHNNSSELRQLQGLTRAEAPSRLKRFT